MFWFNFNGLMGTFRKYLKEIQKMTSPFKVLGFFVQVLGDSHNRKGKKVEWVTFI